jgi:hypothetical protein
MPPLMTRETLNVFKRVCPIVRMRSLHFEERGDNRAKNGYRAQIPKSACTAKW